MLTTHTQRAQAGFPAATQGLRSWEQNPALPHFPGNGTGLNGSFGLYKKLQKGAGHGTSKERISFTSPGDSEGFGDLNHP